MRRWPRQPRLAGVWADEGGRLGQAERGSARCCPDPHVCDPRTQWGSARCKLPFVSSRDRCSGNRMQAQMFFFALSCLPLKKEACSKNLACARMAESRRGLKFFLSFLFPLGQKPNPPSSPPSPPRLQLEHCLLPAWTQGSPTFCPLCSISIYSLSPPTSFISVFQK